MLKLATYIIFLLLISLSVSTEANGRTFDDCDKYRRQGDSLFKAGNYLLAIKKYKSCLIFKEKDEYSVNKIKAIDDIFNKMRIAANLANASKNPEAIDIYRKILLLNPDDVESKRGMLPLLETEADKQLSEGQEDAAAQILTEIIGYADAAKRVTLEAKLKQLTDKKKNPDYLKMMEEGNKLLKAAKYQEAVKKYSAVLNMAGFQKDKQAQQAISSIIGFQENKKNATKFMQESKFLEAIAEQNKVLKEGINDTALKTELLKAYESQADKLLNDGKKDEAILLISKAIEAFDGDNKKQNALQKKMKEVTTAKKTSKD